MTKEETKMGLLKKLLGIKTTDLSTIKTNITDHLETTKELIFNHEDLMDDIIRVVDSGALVYMNGDMSDEEAKIFLQEEDADMKETVHLLEDLLSELKDFTKTIQEASDELNLKEELKACQKMLRHGYRTIRTMQIDYNIVSGKFTNNPYYLVEFESDEIGRIVDENWFSEPIHLSGEEHEVGKDQEEVDDDE